MNQLKKVLSTITLIRSFFTRRILEATEIELVSGHYDQAHSSDSYPDNIL
jgi:hypothetical protein